MKKILAVGLIFLFALSLLAACGGGGKSRGAKSSGGNDDDIKMGVDLAKKFIDMSGGTKEEREKAKNVIGSITNNKWPADKLPNGTPAYPDGVSMTMTDGNTTAIVIRETGEDSLKRYIEMLKKNGWTFSDNQMAEKIGIYEAAKEGWSIGIMQTSKETVSMSVSRKNE